MPDTSNNPEVAALTAVVENLATQVERVTQELRHTNETAQTQYAAFCVLKDQADRLNREIWTSDGASRLRTVELHIKGLYSMVGFVILLILGKLAPTIYEILAKGS